MFARGEECRGWKVAVGDLLEGVEFPFPAGMASKGQEENQMKTTRLANASALATSLDLED